MTQALIILAALSLIVFISWLYIKSVKKQERLKANMEAYEAINVVNSKAAKRWVDLRNWADAASIKSFNKLREAVRSIARNKSSSVSNK